MRLLPPVTLLLCNNPFNRLQEFNDLLEGVLWCAFLFGLPKNRSNGDGTTAIARS